MSRRTALVTAAAIAVALPVACGNAFAQPPVRVGGEFQINTVTAQDQYGSKGSVALDADGDFVVVWSSYQQDDGLAGAFGQRYDSSGGARGVEFRINSHTVHAQNGAVVAADADGDFVVAWNSYSQDGSSFGVFARRFNSAGAALAAEFQVNVYTTGLQGLPSIASDSDGDFIVAWTDGGFDGSGNGIFARRFNSAGIALGLETQINSFFLENQSAAAVDIADSGGFVVAWQSNAQDGLGYGVFAQRFNSLGAKLGAEFQVNVVITGNQSNPSVGLDAQGGFVVVWQSHRADASYELRARRYDSGGTALGTEIPVNQATGSSTQSVLGIEGNGDFVVAWRNDYGGGNQRILARRFRGSGLPASDDFPVNTTVDTVGTPSAGVDGGGDLVVAWSAHDADESGVFGQRFHVPAILDVDGNGKVTALTDGLLILRFLFGFTGVTLTSSAVGPGCTRCDSAAILPYLNSLT